MLIGVDFDNTIVCYDGVFHRAALEKGWIGPNTPRTKEQVRDAMRQSGREEDWIELQGYVYGARMHDADAFQGAREFFNHARQRQIDVCIVSHRTLRPFKGPGYHLHQAGRAWLEAQGFHDSAELGLPRDRVFFELTKQDKLARIAARGCTHFIDDLPEFLSEPEFPDGVERILFDPGQVHRTDPPFHRVDSWAEIESLLLGRDSCAV